MPRGQSTLTPGEIQRPPAIAAVASTSDISSGTARTATPGTSALSPVCTSQPSSMPSARLARAVVPADRLGRGLDADRGEARVGHAAQRLAADDRRHADDSAPVSRSASRMPGTARTVPTLTTGFDGASSTTSASAIASSTPGAGRRLGRRRPDTIDCAGSSAWCRTHHSWKWIAFGSPSRRRPRHGSRPGRRTSAAAARPAATGRTAPRSPRRADSRRAASGCAPGGWRCPCRRARTRPGPRRRRPAPP